MANTSRVNGLRVVKHLNGSPYNGQANIYYVASAADEILVGDPVKQGSTGDANGIPGADLCGTTDVPLGVVVGIMHSKFDPAGNMNTGSTALDLPNSAQLAVGGTGYILVADSPDIIMSVETSNGTPGVANIGLNATHARAATTASTVNSTVTMDVATFATTSTLNFRIVGFERNPLNDMTAASARILVMFNRHQFNSVGTTGIA